MYSKLHVHQARRLGEQLTGKWALAVIVFSSAVGCVPQHGTVPPTAVVAVKFREPTDVRTRWHKEARMTDSVIGVYGSVRGRSGDDLTIAGDSIAVAVAGTRKVTGVIEGTEFVIPYSAISEISDGDSDARKGLLILGAIVLSLSIIILFLYTIGTPTG